MAHAGGRPTKYRPELIDEVDKYLTTTGKEQMHLPKIESFALWLEVNQDTLNEWSKKYPEFSVALDKIRKRQLEQLVDDGIYGGKEVNSTIVKLLLQNNHGMKEKSDFTSDDKPIQSVGIETILKKIYGSTSTPGIDDLLRNS